MDLQFACIGLWWEYGTSKHYSFLEDFILLSKSPSKLGNGDDLHLENENIALFPQEISYMMLLGGLVGCAKSGSWAGSRVVQLRSLVDASAAEDSNYGNNWRPNAISTQRTISDGIEGKIRSVQLQKITDVQESVLLVFVKEWESIDTIHNIDESIFLMLDAWWKPEILPANFVTMCGDHFCRVWNCKNFRHSHFPSNIIHKVHHMWTMSKDEICEIENISVVKGHIFIDFFRDWN